ncbi:hypothetical protein TWF694_004502 [Orbilia ellipsospora]|uniref:MARVEL domain-containing protein n=1 Tax=Orbilia ellipsospora TaxID=2528407 RepID=A0AAV9X1H0_9PEZI
MTAGGSVWPFIPFMALRGAQVFFAIIVLGLSGYVGGKADDFWSPWFCLVTAILTLILSGGLIAAYFVAPAFTAPLITIGIDAFLFLFWIISLGGFADQFSYILDIDNCGGNNICGSIKGNTAMLVFEFLLFLGTLGFSGWLFFRERRGTAAPAGANPEGGHVSAGAIGGAPVATSHGTYPMQQQPPVSNTPVPPPAEYHQQQPVAYPQESQYQYPPQTQSPPPPQQYPEMPIPEQHGGYSQPQQPQHYQQ